MSNQIVHPQDPARLLGQAVEGVPSEQRERGIAEPGGRDRGRQLEGGPAAPRHHAGRVLQRHGSAQPVAHPQEHPVVFGGDRETKRVLGDEQRVAGGRQLGPGDRRRDLVNAAAGEPGAGERGRSPVRDGAVDGARHAVGGSGEEVRLERAAAEGERDRRVAGLHPPQGVAEENQGAAGSGAGPLLGDVTAHQRAVREQVEAPLVMAALVSVGVGERLEKGPGAFDRGRVGGAAAVATAARRIEGEHGDCQSSEHGRLVGVSRHPPLSSLLETHAAPRAVR